MIGELTGYDQIDWTQGCCAGAVWRRDSESQHVFFGSLFLGDSLLIGSEVDMDWRGISQAGNPPHTFIMCSEERDFMADCRWSRTLN